MKLINVFLILTNFDESYLFQARRHQYHVFVQWLAQIRAVTSRKNLFNKTAAKLRAQVIKILQIQGHILISKTCKKFDKNQL